MDTLNRRAFLKTIGAGASGLYLGGFLNSLQAAQTGQKPARIVFFVQGNSLIGQEIAPSGIPFPKCKGKPTAPDVSSLIDQTLDGQTLPFSMEPLQPHIKRMTYVHGLSGAVVGGGHNQGFGALGQWPAAKGSYDATINLALADHIGGIFKHVGLGVRNGSKSVGFDVSSAKGGGGVPTIFDPVLAHQQLFKAAYENAGGAFSAEKRILDFMAKDTARFRKRLAGTEREKLDHYVTAFEEMSGRHDQLKGLAPRIAKVMPEAFDPAKLHLQAAKGAYSGIYERLDAQFLNAEACLVSGLTNVVTVTAGAGRDIIGINCLGEEIDAQLLSGDPAGHLGAHTIGHGGTQAGLKSADAHKLIRRKCMEKLAAFIKRLESIPEGDGSMMDNTLIVYLSDAGEQHHGRLGHWPVVMFGDLGGRLKAGNRYLFYPGYRKDGHKTISNLYLTFLHAVGSAQESFGLQDIRLKDLDTSGPLPELLA